VLLEAQLGVIVDLLREIGELGGERDDVAVDARGVDRHDRAEGITGSTPPARR
jgi:hypothetical protein